MKSVKPSLLTIITIALIGVILIYIINPYSLFYFASLFALLTASLIMLVYLAIAWRKLTKNDRWAIVLSIIGWMAVFYSIVHMNGLTVSTLVGLY